MTNYNELLKNLKKAEEAYLAWEMGDEYNAEATARALANLRAAAKAMTDAGYELPKMWVRV